MTKSQKLLIEKSELTQKINGRLDAETMTDEERSELDTWTKRSTEIETEYRAALVVEGSEEAEARGEFGNGDGESAEVRALLDRVTLNDYLAPAGAGVGIQGAAAELNAALGVGTVGKEGGVLVPWDMALTPEHRQAQRPAEQRAFTTTTQNDGPESQRPILQRLFGPGIMDTLGVRIDSVPVGRTEWPLFSTGVAPVQKKEGVAADAAVAATFVYANLKSKRLTGKYEYTHEAAAAVPDLEQAIRRDLGDAVKSKMSDLIINGAAPTNAAPQNVEGFISELTVADDSAIADAARYGRLHSQGVDGIHAENEMQVKSVIGVSTYTHSAGVYIAGSGESGSELLSRRSGGCVSSSYIPATASMKQSAILHAAGPNGGGMMRGDSVAAMWPTLEIVRDIYSQSSQGVVLTWITLWDAKVALRSDAYKLIGIQIAS